VEVSQDIIVKWREVCGADRSVPFPFYVSWFSDVRQKVEEGLKVQDRDLFLTSIATDRCRIVSNLNSLWILDFPVRVFNTVRLQHWITNVTDSSWEVHCLIECGHGANLSPIARCSGKMSFLEKSDDGKFRPGILPGFLKERYAQVDFDGFVAAPTTEGNRPVLMNLYQGPKPNNLIYSIELMALSTDCDFNSNVMYEKYFFWAYEVGNQCIKELKAFFSGLVEGWKFSLVRTEHLRELFSGDIVVIESHLTNIVQSGFEVLLNYYKVGDGGTKSKVAVCHLSLDIRMSNNSIENLIQKSKEFVENSKYKIS
jgi:acyl-CoA thioesterase FadM